MTLFPILKENNAYNKCKNIYQNPVGNVNGRPILDYITYGVVFVQFHWLNQSHDIQNI